MENSKLYARWDESEIHEGQVQFLLECAKEENRELTEDEARKDADSDSDLFSMYWDDLIEDLTCLMNRINPDGKEWHGEVSNFGWRHQSGCSDFHAKNGRELLQKTLPKTDCTFSIFDDGNRIVIDNAHHDAPCGGEIYTIEVKQDVDEDN